MFGSIQIQEIKHKREELYPLDKIYISKIKTYERLLKQLDQSKLLKTTYLAEFFFRINIVFPSKKNDKSINTTNPIEAMKKFVVTMFNLFVSLLATFAIA